MGYEIGVMGTGRMGVRLATMFAKAGRKVILGSRDRARAEGIVQDVGVPKLSAGTYSDAAGAKIVLPAIFIRDGLFDLLEPFSAELRNKPLIDISNPFSEDYSDFLTPWRAAALKSCSNAFPKLRSSVHSSTSTGQCSTTHCSTGPQAMCWSSVDDQAAKQAVLEAAAGTPFRYLDAGGLINARAVERLTMITGALGRQLGSYPRMNWRLLG